MHIKKEAIETGREGTSMTDLGQEYKCCPTGHTMGSTWYGITCITKVVSWWQVSRTSVQLGEPNGNDGTWTITETKCAAIRRLIPIMRSAFLAKIWQTMGTAGMRKPRRAAGG